MSRRADARRRMAEACLRTLEEVDRACVEPCAPDREPVDARALPVDARALQVRRTALSLRRAFAQVATADVIAVMTQLTASIATHRNEIRASLLAWIDLVDEVISAAQKMYGAHTDSGLVKKDLVKSAILHAMRRAKLDLEAMPDILEPFLYTIIVDFGVEAVYRVSKRQSGWNDHTGHWPRVRMFFWYLTRPAVWFTRQLTRLGWWIVLLRNPLISELDRAVTRASESAHQDVELIGRGVRGVLGLTAWLGEHHHEIAGLFDAVIVAVEEAERDPALVTGADKKAYARDLMYEFLIEDGIIAPSGLGRAFAEAAIDITIDAVVNVLRKHGVLAQRATAALAAGLAAEEARS